MLFFEAYIWALIGLITGSFVNVCIDRLPLQYADKEFRSSLLKSSELSPLLKKCIGDKNLSLFNPTRSFCFYCGNKIKWFENIPLMSYILLKGRCRTCKTILVKRLFWTEAIHCFSYVTFGLFFQNWIWSLFAGINFSFLWILAYCKSYKQIRITLFYTGAILLLVNIMGYLLIKK